MCQTKQGSVISDRTSTHLGVSASVVVVSRRWSANGPVKGTQDLVLRPGPWKRKYSRVLSAWLCLTYMHYTTIYASHALRLGGGLPASLHVEGTQPPRVDGLHYGIYRVVYRRVCCPHAWTQKQKNPPPPPTVRVGR